MFNLTLVTIIQDRRTQHSLSIEISNNMICSHFLNRKPKKENYELYVWCSSQSTMEVQTKAVKGLGMKWEWFPRLFVTLSPEWSFCNGNLFTSCLCLINLWHKDLQLRREQRSYSLWLRDFEYTIPTFTCASLLLTSFHPSKLKSNIKCQI